MIQLNTPITVPEKTDARTLIILVVSIISLTTTTFISIIVSLGSALGSSVDSPIPHAANIAWCISGFAFIPCFIVYLMTLVTQKRTFGYLLGCLIITSGIALAVGVMLSLNAIAPRGPLLDSGTLAGLIIALVAGAIILHQSHGLLE